MDSQTAQRSSEYRRSGLLLMCAVVALVAGYFGGVSGEQALGAGLVWHIAVVAVAYVVAMALLRMIDVLILRREVTESAGRSRALSRDIRHILEKRSPGVAARAAEIDAEALIDKALRDDKKPAPNGNLERT